MAMWVYIPDSKEKEAWAGKISRVGALKNEWKFEIIRHAEGSENLLNTSPFENYRPIIGLLDYQTRCTLLRPIITKIDPGRVGAFFDITRTRVEGVFAALLKGLAVDDPSELLFLGLSFTSDAFTAWYSPPTYRHQFDRDTGTSGLDVQPSRRDTFLISGLGKIECATGSRFSDDGAYSTSVKSASQLKLTFNEAKSLDETHDICLGLERLFGFLIGYRGPLPEFSVWINKEYELHNHKYFYSGTLEIGGTDCVEEDPPHPMRCIHRAGLGEIDLVVVISRFLDARTDLITRIYAVEFCRFFTSNLNESFSIIMPILEQYIKKRYTGPDENSFLHTKERFFSYIDQCHDEEIKEFSRKHIAVKGEKAPSLSTLLERAITHLNSKGFVIPITIAKRIQQRRGRVFHSASDMTEADIRNFSIEIKTAVALVLFHTFEDLGIDPALLAESHYGLRDMAFLMKRPPPPPPQ